MTACELLQPSAAGIVALPASDSERRAYLKHAENCPGCRRALTEAEEMLGLLDAAKTPAPGLLALRRASQQIVSELTWLARQPAVRAFAVVAGWVLLVFLARERAADGWGPSMMLAAAAALIAAFLGALPAAASAIALAAAFVVFSSSTSGLAPATGATCFLVEQVGAILPLAAVFWLSRKTGGGASQALVPAVVAGTLAGEAALYLTCPARNSAGHLWTFHFSGVVVATLLAWAWSAAHRGPGSPRRSSGPAGGSG